MKNEKMTQFERVTQALATADEGFYVRNEDNGREVEVTNMAGGRYLCKDANGEPCRQVDDEAFAYNFLMGRGPIGPRPTTQTKEEKMIFAVYTHDDGYIGNVSAPTREAAAVLLNCYGYPAGSYDLREVHE